jgi:hypothetical protein
MSFERLKDTHSTFRRRYNVGLALDVTFADLRPLDVIVHMWERSVELMTRERLGDLCDGRAHRMTLLPQPSGHPES